MLFFILARRCVFRPTTCLWSLWPPRLFLNTLPLKLLARAACFTALAFLDVPLFRWRDNCFSLPHACLRRTVGRVVAWFLALVPYGSWQWCTSLAQSIGGSFRTVTLPPWCYLCLLCIPIIYCLAMCSAFCLATLSSCAVQLPAGVTKPLEPQINNREPHLSLELLPRLNTAFAWSAELCLVIFMRTTQGNIWGRYLWGNVCGKMGAIFGELLLLRHLQYAG